MASNDLKWQSASFWDTKALRYNESDLHCMRWVMKLGSIFEFYKRLYLVGCTLDLVVGIKIKVQLNLIQEDTQN